MTRATSGAATKTSRTKAERPRDDGEGGGAAARPYGLAAAPPLALLERAGAVARSRRSSRLPTDVHGVSPGFICTHSGRSTAGSLS